MEYEEISLWGETPCEGRLQRFYGRDEISRPGLLIVPGGGYGCVCKATEGDPVAEHFAGLGFQVFTLHYRVAPNCFPAPQLDLARAIRLIRQHATTWKVLPNQLAICGFSAGGHLCACAGTLTAELPTQAGDAADAENGRPDALILCYPVISFCRFAHRGSGENLLGDRFDELAKQLSLENQVDEHTPPTFLWHTAEDEGVPCQNSLMFAEAMREKKRLCELHIFPSGGHGMQLGYGRKDIALWPEMAKNFLSSSCGFTFPSEITPQ
ncbi:MAG: alpha/beta hydrolase [Lentisphaeria bacterium]